MVTPQLHLYPHMHIIRAVRKSQIMSITTISTGYSENCNRWGETKQRCDQMLSWGRWVFFRDELWNILPQREAFEIENSSGFLLCGKKGRILFGDKQGTVIQMWHTYRLFIDMLHIFPSGFIETWPAYFQYFCIFSTIKEFYFTIFCYVKGYLNLEEICCFLSIRHDIIFISKIFS